MAQSSAPDHTTGDPVSPPWLAATLVIVAIISLPALPAGYGADADSWLVASAARSLWETGVYRVSRFPGYPLHEFVSAPLIAVGGCTASNAGTLLAVLTLIAIWYRIARQHGKNPRTLFLSLALAPMVLTNAAATIDYCWSLLFVLLALDSAWRTRIVAAGIWTGIAAGFRPSNLGIVLPLIVLMGAGGETRRRLAVYLAISAVTAILAFLPPLLTYGPLNWIALTQIEMSDIHPVFHTRVLLFTYRMLYALGPAAVLVIIFIFIRTRREIVEHIQRRHPLVLASTIGLLLFTAQFFALPLDRAYLLTAIPFLLLLIDRLASPRTSRILLLCILSLNVVNPDITRHETPQATPALEIRAGRLWEGWLERHAMAERRTSVLPPH